MSRLEVTLPFAPRAWQVPLINDAAPRIVAVVHRRAGKSTGLMWRGIKRGLTIRRLRPRVLHLLPFAVQWDRTGLWDQLAAAAQAIPGAEVRKAERRVVLPNGGSFQAGGFDNPDAWRGGYADEVIADEYDDMPASLIPTVIEPMLADRDGTLVRSGTPKGIGMLKDAYDRAAHAPGYSRYLLRWQDTGVLSVQAIERLRAEMSEEEFAQEMECSFDAPNSGAIYGRLLQAAERDGRITAVPYEPALAVYTAWDLGMRDTTPIWFFQISRGGQWRWIDYEHGAGEGLDHYAAAVRRRGWPIEAHYLPHDVEVRELGTGKSRRAMLESLGIRPVRVVPAANPADRIAAVRRVLPMAWFDAERCAAGLKALWAYRRQWDERLGVFSAQPVHDWASHAADALGTGVQGATPPRDERTQPRRVARHWDPYREDAA